MAKEREVALWQEALKTGEQVHPLTEETLNKHMQGPIIIEDERNAQSVSHLPAYNVFGNSLLHAASCSHQLLCFANVLHCHVYSSKSLIGESDFFSRMTSGMMWVTLPRCLSVAGGKGEGGGGQVVMSGVFPDYSEAFSNKANCHQSPDMRPLLRLMQFTQGRTWGFRTGPGAVPSWLLIIVSAVCRTRARARAKCRGRTRARCRGRTRTRARAKCRVRTRATRVKGRTKAQGKTRVSLSSRDRCKLWSRHVLKG